MATNPEPTLPVMTSVDNKAADSPTEESPATVVPSGDDSHSVTSLQSTASTKEAQKRQSMAQAAVTRVVTKLQKLMTSAENVHLVKSSCSELDLCMNQFLDSHHSYVAIVLPESRRQRVVDKFGAKMIEFQVFRDDVRKWVDQSEERLQDDMDSVSKASTQSSRSSRSRRSRMSRESDVSSKAMRSKLKAAKLAAEKSVLEESLKEERDLQQRKVELERDLQHRKVDLERDQQQRKMELDHDIKRHQMISAVNLKLARAKAEEDVLSEHQMTSVNGSSCKPLTDIPPVTRPSIQRSVHSVHVRDDATPDQVLQSNIQPVTNAVYVKDDAVATPFVTASVTTPTQGDGILQLVSSMRLPPLRPETFDGDHRSFHSFEIAFDSHVIPLTANDSDRLAYLNMFLRGEPKELISGCIFMSPDEGYVEARRLLREEYGNPFKVASSFLNRLYSWPVIKPDDGSSLKRLSTFLGQCQQAMTKVEELVVLNHVPNLQEVVRKLPTYLQNKWCDVVTKSDPDRKVGFVELRTFIKDAAQSANHPVFSKGAIRSTRLDSQPAVPTVKPKSSFATNLQSSTDVKQPSTDQVVCAYCLYQHDLDDCKHFNKLSMEDRRKFIMEKKLCFACLCSGHIARGCVNQLTCKVCARRHPTSLHMEVSANSQPKAVADVTSSSPTGSSDVGTIIDATVQVSACNVPSEDSDDVVTLHSIIPVRVRQRGSDNSVLTYAFFDNGSSGCFLTNRLKEDLHAYSSDVLLELRTMHGRGYVSSTVVRDLEVCDIRGENSVIVQKCYTREEIPVECDQIPRPEVLEGVDYLQDVVQKLPEYMPGLHIGLLIGASCPAAIQPLMIVPTNGDGPFAMLLRHGWTINGSVHVANNGGRRELVYCNRIDVVESSPIKEVIIPPPDAILTTLEKDFHGCCVGTVPSERGPSVEDLRFLKHVEQTWTSVDGHSQISLPFRQLSPAMPNNRSQAIRRANLQKRKMLKDETYYEEYLTFINKLLSKGYAEKIPSDELNDCKDGSVWYLPHHAVYHPTKKKLRVVFDCAARYGDTSLNDQLMQGPDLTSSIIGVLTRFRDGEVAFTSDIETMFYQVRVPSEQRNYLRFVWWPNGDLHSKLEDYRMTVHLFGASSSPSVANYALRKLADGSSPSVASTLTRNFYVDDCLKAVQNEDVGLQLVQELCDVCTLGGFHLTKFVSNSRVLLQSLPAEERASEIQMLDLSKDSLPFDRTLGVQWDVSSDQFGFSINVRTQAMSRRGILSTVASVYDPLGFLAPFILPAKQILQELCRQRELGWDDEIPHDTQVRWARWLLQLPSINQFIVSRCFTPIGFGDVASRQLHVFSDASSEGYGCCAYLRLVNLNGSVHCCLLLGKSRVAPLRMVTIPRLELTAATVSIQVGQMLMMELEQKPDSITYHTDSTTVLFYIHSERKRFPVFVSNRVQQIHDFSEPGQWKYVPSELNPADGASRGLAADKLLNHSLWLHGPPFLLSGEFYEPQPDAFLEPEQQSEVESISVNVVSVAESTGGLRTLIDYYSSWFALKKAVAVFQRLQRLLKHRREEKRPASVPEWVSMPFSVQEIEDAGSCVIRFIQSQHFADDVERLHKKDGSKKGTRLIHLDPFLKDGLLRVGGRLRKSCLNEEEKHPTILPKNDHVTAMIIREVHERVGHAGRSHVLSTLRERFWVVAGSATVRQVIAKCVVCRRLRGQLCDQKMADLPFERTSTEPPFTYTGVDLFGPFSVKNARSYSKRYGVIFTCLSSRSVHLEVAKTLETDSFLNCLRRFLARRGPVRSIFCDNGTNFVGAEKELRKAVNEMDTERIQKYLLGDQIDWRFNPPAASHMGGVWERQIRTVRKVLSGLLRDVETRLDDDSLHTLFCEVENIVNSRPITPLTDDPNDSTALTPNHILTAKSRILMPPPGTFQKEDVYMRKRWRRVQYLANVFWSRWKREYLMSLQSRKKWTGPKRNISVGDVVIVQDDTAPRNRWPMGRVIDVRMDSNGFVRSCNVKTQSSTLHRPVHKLVLLVPSDT